MRDQYFRSVLKEAAFGFISHDILSGGDGQIVDFRITEVNNAFEKIAGKKASALRKKLVSEVFLKDNGSEDMAAFYKQIRLLPLNGNREFFFNNTKRWYNVQIINTKTSQVSLFFHDITILKNLQNELDSSGYLLVENESLLKMSRSVAESEDKYRTLAEQLPVGVYRTTTDGQIVYSNLALARMLGYESVEELLSLNVEDLYSNPGNRQRQLISAEKKGGVVLSEFQLRKKDGEQIWVRDNTRLIHDQKGSPVYFDGILEDITEERTAELLLKENEAQLKAIIENTLEDIWSVNLNYEIEYVNEKFIEAFLYSFGKRLARGVNIIESLPEFLRPLWKERYDKAFRNEHFLFEDKIETDHGIVYAEVAMNPIVIDGNVVGVSVYGRDVTEKMMYQIQLQYQSELRSILVELSSRFINLPIGEINDAIRQSLAMIGEFVGADRAYVFEYNFEADTCSNTFEWCREGIKPFISELQNIDLSVYDDIVQFHKNGELVKVDDFRDLLHGPLRLLLEDQKVISLLTIPLMKERQCTGFVGFDSVRGRHVYNDYEEQLLQVYAQTIVNALERVDKEKKLVQAKEKAEESDRLKSAFLANMSHEIRTPMSGIIGFLNLLNEPDLSEENKSTYINIVTQSGNRLLETINDIIEISKIESGVMQVNLSVVNIRELFGFYDGFFRQQADQKGLEYSVKNNLPSEIQYVMTDKKKLDSIISNLIKNAVKFTPSGSIKFTCELSDGRLLFSVKDTGVGIPEERLTSVFDRFVQADISTSRPHEGSGLGLAIVKAYIGMLGGDITVESRVGKGTEFIFAIPYKQAGIENSKPVNGQAESRSIKSGIRILIAEDDYASYLFVQKVLENDGITLVRTVNGEDTIEAVKKDPGYSLILMDIKMPGMSGLDATRKIREFNKDIPIIAQTAYSLSGDRELALEAGCSDYIAKPINRKELQNMIRKHTGK